MTLKCLIALLLLAWARPASAQRVQDRFDLQPASALQARSGGSAFIIEGAGGIAGSLAGFALVYSAASECDSDDLVCYLRHAGAAIAVGTAGAATGVYLAGKLGDTNPSAVGAIVGAIAGAGAGLGVVHLVTEELNLVNSDAGAIITFGVTQGMVAALGSRIARSL